MAPAFAVTTLDGRRVSLDDLSGKVVLLDFWATWCGPCREALPHMRDIAKKFQGEPFVVLSVSLDDDESKWKDYIAKNGMTWLQYRDGGFKGSIAQLFAVEGKLKKLIARAPSCKPRRSSRDFKPENRCNKKASHAGGFFWRQAPGRAVPGCPCEEGR